MLGKVEEKMEEKAMVQFLSKFDDDPFLVKFKDAEYPIGTGTPTFTVNFKKAIPVSDLLNSTSRSKRAEKTDPYFRIQKEPGQGSDQPL